MKRPCGPQRVRPAFSLIDLLVSITVIAVLIGLLLPSLSAIRETTRRVVCGSNVRQIGFGVALYADDNRDYLPTTVHTDPFSTSRKAAEAPPDSMSIRFPEAFGTVGGSWWDGLGHLFSGDYLPAPKLFYCPSHIGDHPFDEYEDQWRRSIGEIVCNYQYRGAGPNGERRLSQIIPPHVGLLADGLRTIDDFNHNPGLNILFADLSVEYLVDESGSVTRLLPSMVQNPGSGGGGGGGGSEHLEDTWDGLDRLGN